MSEQLDLSSDKGQEILDLAKKIYMAFRFASVDNVMTALNTSVSGMLVTMQEPARARDLFVSQLDRMLAFMTKYPDSHPFLNFEDEDAPVPDPSMTTDTAYTTLLLIRWRDAAEKLSFGMSKEVSLQAISDMAIANKILLDHAKTLGSVSS